MTKLTEAFPTRLGGYWGKEAGTSDIDARAIRNGDVGTSGELRWEALPQRAYTSREFAKAQVHAGDVVLTTSGNCGNAAYIGTEPEEPTVATNFVRILRVDPEKTDSRYAFHFLRTRSFSSGIAPFVRGATIKNLSVDNAFATVEIPHPPLPEQRSIAAILDHADTLRAKRRQVFGHVDDLTQSVFRATFGKGEYPSQRLDELIDASDRMNYGVVQPGDDTPGGVALIRVSDLAGGIVDRTKLKRISSEIEASYVRSRLRGNEILVSSVGSVGAVSLVRPPDVGSNIARAVTRVPISNEVLRTYVAAYLRTSTPQRYFVAELRTVAQPTLNVGQLAATQVPLPPVDLQLAFRQRLHAIQESTQALVRVSVTDDELFTSLQSRAFRGEL